MYIYTLIALAAVLVGVGMARSRKRKRFRAYLKGQINHKLNIGTLATKTLVGSNIVDVLDEQAWLSSVKATWTLKNVTPGATVGPLLVGIAHPDYTDAEVEEWIENSASWERFDQIGQEVAKRKIRKVGMFRGTGGIAEADVLNDGRPITTKAGWMLGTGQSVKIWAYNSGGGAYATTDPDLRVEGHANLWPR